MHRLLRFFFAALAAALPVAAQDGSPRVVVSAQFEPATATPGSEVTLVVTLDVDDGWHVYGSKETQSPRTALRLSDTGELRVVGDPKVPPGIPKTAAGDTHFELKGKVLLKQTLKVPAALGAGAQTVRGTASFMVCDETMCLPPQEEPFVATLAIGAAGGGATAAASDEPVSVAARFATERASPGDEVTLEVTLDVADGYHVYGSKETLSRPVALAVTDTGELRVAGDAEIPAGDEKVVETTTSWELKGKVVLRQKLKVPAGLSAGTQTVRGKVSWMACDEQACFPPAEQEFTVTLAIGAPQVQQEPKKPPIRLGFDDEKVQASARIEPASAAAGSDATLVVTLSIVDGWHVYGSLDKNSIPTRLTLLDTGALRAVGGAIVPPGVEHKDAINTNYWLTGEVELRHALRVPEGASGEQRVTARVEFMPCDESQCLDATSLDVEAVLTIAGGGGAVQPSGPKAFAWTQRFEPVDPRPGEAVDVVIAVQLAPGVTVTGGADEKPTSLLVAGALLPVGKNRLPGGSETSIAGKPRFVIDGGFELRQALRVPVDAKPGPLTVPLELRYELHDADGALARTEPVSVAFDVVAGEARSEYLGAAARVDEYGGVLGLLLAAIGAGLLALLMPCTYPMIPITISFFTKQAAARHGSVLPLALAYGLGIVLMFIAIGLFAARVIVPFATHWITNAVITAAFLLFAASLFGLVTLQPPQWLLQFAGRASSKGGYLGVFLMGATLVVTSFTCTVPVAGALLSLTADGGGWYVVLGMATFGLTMAVPFVALSLLPGRLRQVPRAGEWMNTLKVFLGFVEIAAAMKFASSVDLALHDGEPRWLEREPFLWVWVALFVVAAGYLLLPLLRGQVKLRAGRAIGLAFSLAFAGYSGYGALGNDYPKGDVVMPALAPPKTTDPSKHDKVKDDYVKALARAKASGKLLLINFTGFQCVNCRVMEQTVLPAPKVAPLLERHFVEARLHTDHPDAEKGDANRKRQMATLGYIASPYYFVIDPATEREMGRFSLSNVGKDWEQLFADFLSAMLAQR
ncbi:MAG: thioredoxin family protein [Planctomycetes bacterium]|nr:thioredoxin family protein [Planctomycetota bacterium]